MKIKTRMIGMDLDGTLLKSDKELTQYTKDVLKRAIEQGIIVMPATGRPITGVPKELLEFPGIRYAVTANGGRVIDLEKNEAIVEELLPHDIAEVMMDVFEHYDTFRVPGIHSERRSSHCHVLRIRYRPRYQPLPT